MVNEEKHQLLKELQEKTGSESSQLAQLEKQCDLLAQEKEKLQEMLGGIQAEKSKLEIKLQKSVDKVLNLCLKIHSW